MATISLNQMMKRYPDGYVAVRGVSLDIADGEFMTLVGPSGCGKSTLLRMIVGLEDITSGELHIGGERVNDKAPRDRNLAMVFQNYALYPHLTVFENIAFPLRVRERLDETALRNKVENVARRLDLTEHLDRKPSQLSGGQRQRAAMGRAIVREPNAFLFDEPLSNLDAKLRAQMRIEISRLQRQLGVTTVYVTHDQTEALTLGDRVAVLNRGVLEQVADPRELYDRPASAFVAGFIGSPAMNFVPARLDGTALTLPFTSVALSAAARARVAGRELVIAGIRPEHFELAALIDGTERAQGVTFRAEIGAVEWLGSQQFAYLPYEPPAELEHQLVAQSRELDADPQSSQLTVSIDASSRLRAGETAEFWFPEARIHLFDVESGANLTCGAPERRRRSPAP